MKFILCFIFGFSIASGQIEWDQRGLDIDGEAAEDASGYSVPLSSDGSVVAIGANGNDGRGEDAGHVRIYEWSGTDWQQRGGDIDGEGDLDESGHSVSLSSDGSVVAIGAPQTYSGGSGYVRVFAIDQKQDECDTEALISAVITLTEQLAQKDAQIAQLQGRPTQAAYDQVVQELNARPTLEDIQEARSGSVILTPTANGTVILRMMIEESSDLSVWEQNGESVEVELPLAEGKKFLRFAFPAGN